ncbi:sigma-70 family RNA polymerase sigma factor [Psychrobacter sp. 5A.1]|uniref:sigma-70 family RNA polymerase sigma factor n=1 Tax=Psychrobacter sp. 5A.1 TaxID=3035207 RepID=UPI0025B4B58E|nr:sigma-70 family RNA polymerase sigma factor [Psychrobacter sp. 5A.1]MDN3502764.1 sigma-70 family RNA polymerase sigma factor [Psychrobacter sp. 5A.1]
MTDSNQRPVSKFGTVTPEFVTSVRQQMLAFACCQLADNHLAEDVVQDALMAALQYGDQFKGEAAFKTWVFAILKNKIVDCIRKNSKYTNMSSMQNHEEGNEETLIDALFNDAGSWHKSCRPSQFDNSWSNPDVQVQSAGFWKVLEACLTNLPSEQARAFLMREYIELDTHEICRTLEISTSNYYVLMHRARLGLQTCLTIRWFDSEPDASHQNQSSIM